jgi:hypothetical protein
MAAYRDADLEGGFEPGFEGFEFPWAFGTLMLAYNDILSKSDGELGLIVVLRFWRFSNETKIEYFVE